jgi:hypothetical protein
VCVPRVLKLGQPEVGGVQATAILTVVQGLVAFLAENQAEFFVADYNNVDTAYFRLAQIT